MKQIWKYDLAIAGIQDIKMPEGAEVLTVQVQRGVACIWALITPELKQVVRQFTVVGTGHDIASQFEMNYIGTFQINGGDLVFHVFELL